MRGGLLAGQQAGAQPAVDRAVGDAELVGGLLDRAQSSCRGLAVVRPGSGIVLRTVCTRDWLNGSPVPVRRPCLLRIAAISWSFVCGGEPADQIDGVLAGALALARRGGSAAPEAWCGRRPPRRSRPPPGEDRR